MKQAMLERAVLASVIMGEALPSSLDLEEQHFGDPLCRQLFGVLMKMEKHHQQIDLPSVCMADETLDAYEVCELAKESCVSVVLVNQHCEHLRNIAQRRKMSALLARVQSALEAGADVLEQADAIRKELDTLMSRSMTQTQEGTDYERYLMKYQQEQQKLQNALSLYQTLGYATPEIAEILGIEASAPSSTGGGTYYYDSDPSPAPAPAPTGDGLENLWSKYPSGKITSLSIWNNMVAEYGEDALKEAGFYYQAPEKIYKNPKGATGSGGPLGKPGLVNTRTTR